MVQTQHFAPNVPMERTTIMPIWCYPPNAPMGHSANDLVELLGHSIS